MSFPLKRAVLELLVLENGQLDEALVESPEALRASMAEEYRAVAVFARHRDETGLAEHLLQGADEEGLAKYHAADFA